MTYDQNYSLSQSGFIPTSTPFHLDETNPYQSLSQYPRELSPYLAPQQHFQGGFNTFQAPPTPHRSQDTYVAPPFQPSMHLPYPSYPEQRMVQYPPEGYSGLGFPGTGYGELEEDSGAMVGSAGDYRLHRPPAMTNDTFATCIARHGDTSHRMPSYSPVRRTPSIGTSHISAISSATGSSWRTGSTQSIISGSSSGGLDMSQPSTSSTSGAYRTVKRRHHDPNGPKRKTPSRTEPLSDNDNINITNAINFLNISSCQTNAWLPPGRAKNNLANEACQQANSTALSEGREASVIDCFFLADVNISSFPCDVPSIADSNL